ncbi:exodeoxyribonuclease V subunit gamma [Candidatus Erwinia haradaeae]|uniref:RecBCD enzyme subunit RecC n=1 Tax=Candidatus Erwinia haradaeae TaxID=1922217 RepID=A0A803FU10_9GAMM|nr:exodeoxyribonuclease V subunit gamma [Candidatus Erwinia haradaeae]VFP88409.1 RecBCD enzyme subunit RecC [Candidatus Erwinia haradaeae]
MLTIYHSNDLEILKNIVCCEIESKPLLNPLCSEVLVVQSRQTEEWLQIKLAEEFGIAANIDFFLPSSFIWEMFFRIFPGIYKTSAFNQFSICWKLRDILPKILFKKSFIMLRQYLSDDQEYRKLFQLTARIAQLFEQYSIHQPEWLNLWENGDIVESGLGENQIWQSALWMELVKHTKQLGEPIWHRAGLYQRFISTLNQRSSGILNLPSRIFVFGVSSLPAEYLQTLGKHTDLYLLCINPCRYYWSGTQDQQVVEKMKNHSRSYYKNKKPISRFCDSDDVNFSLTDTRKQKVTNPLLASWGQQGEKHFFLLEKIESHKVSAFVDIEATSLIKTLQRDILELEDHSFIGVNSSYRSHSHVKRILTVEDRSVEIHLCHSIKREVEVLQDQLLNMMDKDSSLTVGDIIVMVSDINAYAPFIKSIFGKASPEHAMPFTISDYRMVNQTNLFFQSFMTLLTLPDSRFTAEEVISLLEIPSIASRFSIDAEGLAVLRKWVSRSGVRWGLDDEVFDDIHLPISSQHTWNFGLTRMLLGYGMHSQAGPWEGVLPFDECCGLMAELAGNLSEFLMNLMRWKKLLHQSLDLSGWLPICRQILNDFFLKDRDNEIELEFIEQKWSEIINYGIDSLYQKEVPLSRLREEIELQFNSQKVKYEARGGTINFCALASMRCVPVKVICLLGMNDGVYPRTRPPCSIDLMQSTISTENASSCSEDHYLFLEILCSVREKLYISYIFRSIEDNTLCYSSILVSELIDYISRSFCLSEDIDRDIDISAKAVVKHLQYLHSRMPFAPENFNSQSKFHSFSSEWLPAARRLGMKHTPFIQNPLKEHKINLNLNQLLSFWCHPVRSFFQSRLGVRFKIEESILLDTEPFLLDELSCYQMNRKLLDNLIHDKKIDVIYEEMRASGILPYGVWGDLFFKEQEVKMNEVAKKVKSHYTRSENRDISLMVDGFMLTGSLTEVQVNGLLRWSPSILHLAQGLKLWLEHLVYCATGGSGFSFIFGCNNSFWHFLPLSIDHAYKYLSDYIHGYRLGMCSPLLLTSSGGRWLQECFDKKADIVNYNDVLQKKAYRTLLQSWHGNDQIRGEKNDFYLQRLVTSLDKESIKIMIEQAERWYAPVLQYNKVS